MKDSWHVENECKSKMDYESFKNHFKIKFKI